MRLFWVLWVFWVVAAAATSRLFIYLFLFYAKANTDSSARPFASSALEIAADCLTSESCTCGFHSPASTSAKCVCLAHATIFP